MAELIAASGTQLDPAIVSALIAVLERDQRQTLPLRTTKVADPAAAEPVPTVPAGPALLADLDAAAAAG
jgi:ribosomal protein S12 methylthiotransferase accessory factor YcaO